ncbi:diphthamide biosynthesis protein 2 [Rhinocladiella mackenziei CBS 650.93]|uniref:2-(3-amino-3-carboxypropyl)histidine synthase subunit 2 n=1 Tax=Rhinocladiella mackenziei CBS 650.93 TaxID=1442369 RepID=A0A0D2IUY6_9EURO|nr:diphthamide biosynthesis protein 2 [Rhinocladiella mackenziei CBS 650.93]KIX06966.1 diphthamide biosynthesis protein 2 [Rhinocladiella mackenziei CBS 650.93]
MAENLTAPPALSTPDTRILSEGVPDLAQNTPETLSEEQLQTRYEVRRTINEIKQRKWNRVALQFPDHMLQHAARVYQLLARGLRDNGQHSHATAATDGKQPSETHISELSIEEDIKPVRLTILGDTSYGSCCVDEIAAEHVDADAVVHYGRACLSPTARLPVLHIFTTMDLDYDSVVKSFQASFPERDAKVVLTADVPYATHVQAVYDMLQNLGYSDVFAASIVHDPSSSIPNRTVPASVSSDPSSLSDWSLFHISEPPTSLLLTLTSCMANIRVYPTTNDPSATASLSTSFALEHSTKLLLRRRYALITSLTTVPAWGILINTLSVKNYLHILSHIQRQIAAAGKKSYLLVVGKLNPAKIANFSEIGGWVVIGCWESSLVDSKEFYKPIITPFELELALQTDESRLWTGDWRADFQGVLENAAKRAEGGKTPTKDSLGEARATNGTDKAEIDMDSESESEPPEFDLRTGRYIARTRPTRNPRTVQAELQQGTGTQQSTALAKRNKGDVIAVNGVVSPAAEFLAQKRTWRGLGSDFEVKYEEDDEVGGMVEEGRAGIAKGYTVGGSLRT